MEIKVGVSNRHIHFKKEDYMLLFGNQELTKKNDLSQNGEYATNSVVSLKTNKGVLENVRIVAPFREHTQVEISKTDAYKLGINPPIRMSGNFDGAVDIVVCNKDKEILIKNACILANRHIHLNQEESNKYNIKHGDKVRVSVSGERGGILDNVLVKVRENYNMELHLDTDEANAFGLKNGDKVTILEDSNGK